jgi:hypothetical protein
MDQDTQRDGDTLSRLGYRHVRSVTTSEVTGFGMREE